MKPREIEVGMVFRSCYERTWKVCLERDPRYSDDGRIYVRLTYLYECRVYQHWYRSDQHLEVAE